MKFSKLIFNLKHYLWLLLANMFEMHSSYVSFFGIGIGYVATLHCNDLSATLEQMNIYFLLLSLYLY